jgi:hypothetical protein
MAKKPNAKVSQSDDFVSDAAVSSGRANYMKLETGTNKFRALSKPIIGWIVWEEDEEGNRKPVRTQINDEPENPTGEDKDRPKKFMAMAVLDHADGEVKILEITQQSIIKAIKAYAANPDWGNPFTYDITISKSGEGLKTKYNVQPSPKKPLAKNLIAAANEKPCNLDALYDGADPWDVDNGEVTEYHFK